VIILNVHLATYDWIDSVSNFKIFGGNFMNMVLFFNFANLDRDLYIYIYIYILKPCNIFATYKNLGFIWQIQPFFLLQNMPNLDLVEEVAIFWGHQAMKFHNRKNHDYKHFLISKLDSHQMIIVGVLLFHLTLSWFGG
jgi:hypothetical protein